MPKSLSSKKGASTPNWMLCQPGSYATIEANFGEFSYLANLLFSGYSLTLSIHARQELRSESMIAVLPIVITGYFSAPGPSYTGLTLWAIELWAGLGLESGIFRIFPRMATLTTTRGEVLPRPACRRLEDPDLEFSCLFTFSMAVLCFKALYYFLNKPKRLGAAARQSWGTKNLS